MYTVQDESISSVADAIRAKTGKSAEMAFPDEFVTEINNIQTGGTGDAKQIKDVNFFDYDGTLIESYTQAEAEALTELPTPPTHPGLVFQEWNHSLDDIHAWPSDVGAHYTTDDGATRIFITIPDTPELSFTLSLGQSVDNGINVDWGDGTTDGSGVGADVVMTHEYAEPGDYVVSFRANGECIITFNGFMPTTGHDAYYWHHLQDSFITMVLIGDNVSTLSSFSFYKKTNMRYISIPCSCKTIGNSVFKNSGLRFISIPRGTMIDGNCFVECSLLTYISFPRSMIWPSEGLFESCSSIKRVVTSGSRLSNNQISECTALETLIVRSDTVRIESYAICYDYNLKKITCDNVIPTKDSAFYKSAIENVEIPDNVITIYAGMCNGDAELKTAVLGTGISKIPNSVFEECQSLAIVTCRGDIQSIGSYVFSKCISLKTVDFTNCTGVPTLSNTNAFTEIPTDCEILVPASLESEWKTATNWTVYADNIKGV